MTTSTNTPVRSKIASTPVAKNTPGKLAVAGAESVKTDLDTTGPVPAVTETLQPVVTNRQLRNKELAERVAERTGMSKAQVKPIIAATLTVIGDVLAENRGLILPPLGRVKLQRAKGLADGRVMTLKLRQKTVVPTVSDENDI